MSDTNANVETPWYPEDTRGWYGMRFILSAPATEDVWAVMAGPLFELVRERLADCFTRAQTELPEGPRPGPVTELVVKEIPYDPAAWGHLPGPSDPPCKYRAWQIAAFAPPLPASNEPA